MTNEQKEFIHKFNRDYEEKVKNWVANKDSYVFEKIVYTLQGNIKIGVIDENEYVISGVILDGPVQYITTFHLNEIKTQDNEKDFTKI